MSVFNLHSMAALIFKQPIPNRPLTPEFAADPAFLEVKLLTQTERTGGRSPLQPWNDTPATLCQPSGLAREFRSSEPVNPAGEWPLHKAEPA